MNQIRIEYYKTTSTEFIMGFCENKYRIMKKFLDLEKHYARDEKTL